MREIVRYDSNSIYINRKWIKIKTWSDKQPISHSRGKKGLAAQANEVVNIKKNNLCRESSCMIYCHQSHADIQIHTHTHARTLSMHLHPLGRSGCCINSLLT